ncbi:hypothetical protein [Streptomyces griseoluteus]|uniref:hypothetical protein n=1 Tax=Streptomyces griseoluteus TaxID=29306 RepID=UPI0037031A5D
MGTCLTSKFGKIETVKYTLSSKIAYTTVGEAHAYWDTKATFDYDAKLSSTIDTGYSGGGTNWTLSGSRSVGGSIGHATGYSNKGPYFAKQWKVPIRYTKYKKVHYCNGVQRSKWYTIEAGRYDIPGGGSTGKYGKDVRSKDGTKFYDVPKSRTAVVPKGSYFQLSGGRSITWTGAATVYGLTIGASTSYDRDHKQRITAGNGRYKHYIWGLHDKPSGNPGIFLSDWGRPASGGRRADPLGVRGGRRAEGRARPQRRQPVQRHRGERPRQGGRGVVGRVSQRLQHHRPAGEADRGKAAPRSLRGEALGVQGGQQRGVGG